MGKFCVKAAIVSSLAIAEEDYDTTIGAPIELKRNLIARGTARPLKGQTPQIISEGGSLRALGEGKRVLSIFSSIPVISSIEQILCCNQEKKNNGNEDVGNQTDAGSKSFGGFGANILGVVNKSANDMWNSKNILDATQRAIDLGSESINAAERKLKEYEEQLKTSMEDLQESIIALPEKTVDGVVNTDELKRKIDGTLTIVPLFSALLPQDMQDSVKEMTDSLQAVKDTVETTGEGLKEDLTDKIKTQFNSANEKLKGFFEKAEKTFIDSTGNTVNTIQGKLDGVNRIRNSLGQITSQIGTLWQNSSE